MLSLDKTHLSTNFGDKHAHCVYLSCANIQKDVQMKASAHCWLKITEIPIVKFQRKTYQGVLSQCLYHQCMEIVTETLRACSKEPVWMTDANRKKRLVRTILFAFLADNPEQQMIACCSGDASYVTLTRYQHLGTGKKQPPCTGVGTLQRIRALVKKHDPNNLHAYIKGAREMGLSGVHKPFWRNWIFADPCEFLALDALHQWHKFFWVHIMDWARTLIGEAELD